MSDATLLGLQALCLFMTAPAALGVLVGWMLRGRALRLGLPWAFLPHFAKRLYESIKVQLEQEADE